MAAIPPGGGDMPGLAAIAAAAIPMNVLENQEPSVTMKAQVSLVGDGSNFCFDVNHWTAYGIWPRACLMIN